MNKHNLYWELLILAIIAFPVAFAIYSFDQLPETIVTHYNIKGEADGFAHKNLIHFLILPGINLLMNFFMAVLPGILPEDQRAESNLRLLQAVRIATAILLSGIALMMVTSASDHNAPDALRWVGGGLFLIISLVGNYMKELKPNEFAGVRNKYTLNDPVVWKNTHRRSSYLFFYTGWIGLVSTLLVDVPGIFFVSLGALITLSIISWRISKTEFQKRHNE